MSDFFQPGAITTLHRLPGGNPAVADVAFAALPPASPIVLVLPAHQRELGTAVFHRILGTVLECPVFCAVIVVVNGAAASELAALAVRHAREEGPALVIRNGDPGAAAGWLGSELNAGETPLSGKGWNLWVGIACARVRYPEACVLCHDSDIASYGIELPARLAYPLVQPPCSYHFAKGYYVRVGGRLYGRVTRLFVMPLLRALVRVGGHTPFLDFLNGFRYILAGECALHPSLAGRLRMPLGWGVDLGLLAEAYRLLEPEQICQVDLGTNYQHKHQLFDPGQPDAGLARMAREITFTLLRELKKEGMPLAPGTVAALTGSYARQAGDALRRHRDDAAYNGLAFDVGQEEALVGQFIATLEEAAMREATGHGPSRAVAPPIDEALEAEGRLGAWLAAPDPALGGR